MKTFSQQSQNAGADPGYLLEEAPTLGGGNMIISQISQKLPWYILY